MKKVRKPVLTPPVTLTPLRAPQPNPTTDRTYNGQTLPPHWIHPNHPITQTPQPARQPQPPLASATTDATHMTGAKNRQTIEDPPTTIPGQNLSPQPKHTTSPSHYSQAEPATIGPFLHHRFLQRQRFQAKHFCPNLLLP